jgi:hypothetical protein
MQMNSGVHILDKFSIVTEQRNAVQESPEPHFFNSSRLSNSISWYYKDFIDHYYYVLIFAPVDYFEYLRAIPVWALRHYQ